MKQKGKRILSLLLAVSMIFTMSLGVSAFAAGNAGGPEAAQSPASLQSTSDNVVYVSYSGADSNNGLTSATPVLTLMRAYRLLDAQVQENPTGNAYIVICGTVPYKLRTAASGSDPKTYPDASDGISHSYNITFTSKYGGENFQPDTPGPNGAKLSFYETRDILGPTTFKDIEFRTGTTTTIRLGAAGYPLMVDTGVTTSVYSTGSPLALAGASVVGNLGSASAPVSTNLTVRSGTWQNIYGGSYSGVTYGDTNVTIEGGEVITVLTAGTYSGAVHGNATLTIDADNFVHNGAYLLSGDSGGIFGGSVQAAINGNVTVNILGSNVLTTGIFGGGRTASSTITGKTTVNIGGNVVVPAVYGSKSGTVGDVEINVTGAATIGELSGGGQFGKTAASTAVVNIAGGNITGNVSVAGIAPASAIHLDLTSNDVAFEKSATVKNVAGGSGKLTLASTAELTVTGSVTGSTELKITGTPAEGHVVVTAPAGTPESAFTYSPEGGGAASLQFESGAEYTRWVYSTQTETTSVTGYPETILMGNDIDLASMRLVTTFRDGREPVELAVTPAMLSGFDKNIPGIQLVTVTDPNNPARTATFAVEVTVPAGQGTEDVIFVSSGGSNANDGTSPAKAVQDLLIAYSKLKPSGGTIVVCGSVTGAGNLSAHTGVVTITSDYNHVNYRSEGAKLTFTGDTNLNGNTTFTKIALAATGVKTYLSAQGHALVMGDDVECSTGGEEYLTLLGGAKTANIAVDTTSVTLVSGTFQDVYGGGYSGAVTGDTKLDISGGEVKNIIAGAGHSGTVTGNVYLTIRATSPENFVHNVTYDDLTFPAGVYGGSIAGKVEGDVHVDIGDSTVINTGVYGGGRDASSETTGTTYVNVDGDAEIVARFYGGGKYGKVNHVEVNVSDNALITGNSYLGAWMGTIAGNLTGIFSDNSVSAGIYYTGSRGSASTAAIIQGNVSFTLKDQASVGSSLRNGGAYGIINGTSYLEVRDSAYVSGNFDGAGYYGLSRSNGKVTLVVDGGTIEGNVNGGSSYNGRSTAGAEIILKGGSIGGDISFSGVSAGATAASIDLTGGKLLSFNSNLTVATVKGGGSLVVGSGKTLTVTGSMTGVTNLSIAGIPSNNTYIIAPGGTPSTAVAYTPSVAGETLICAEASTVQWSVKDSAVRDLKVFFDRPADTVFTLYSTYDAASGSTVTPNADGSYTLATGLYRYNIRNVTATPSKYYALNVMVYITADEMLDALVNSDGVMHIDADPGETKGDGTHQPFPTRNTTTQLIINDEMRDAFYSTDTLKNFPEGGYKTPAFAPDKGKQEFTSTDEILAFLQAMDTPDDNLYFYEVGKTDGLNIPIYAVIFTTASIPAQATLEEAIAIASEDAQENNKVRILNSAQIHGNETSGGEGALVMILELDGEYGEKILEDANVIIYPRINGDGASNYVRTTSDGNDANRDKMSLQNGENVLLAYVFNLFMPELVIDNHEFTGSSVTSTGIGSDDIQVGMGPFSYTGEDMDEYQMYDLTQYTMNALREEGLRTTPYTPSIGTIVGTTYYGLTGCANILLESRGISIGKDFFERRVHAQVTAAKTLYEKVIADKEKLIGMVADRRAYLTESGGIYDNTDPIILQTGKTGKTTIVYDYPSLRYDGTSRPGTQTVSYYDTATRTRTRPTGYFVEKAAAEKPGNGYNEGTLVEMMENHFIEFYFLPAGTTVNVQQLYATSATSSIVNTAALRNAADKTFADGVYFIPMDQVRNPVIAYLLEQDCSDNSSRSTTEGTLYQRGYFKLEAGTNNLPIYHYTQDNPRSVLSGLTSLVSIEVTTPPAKISYTVGEALDLTGMVVTATYSDESTSTVVGYVTVPPEGTVLNTVGEPTILVSYAEGDITKPASFTVTVNDPSAVDITAAFTDPNFKAAVYELIGKTAPAPIYGTDVANITELDVSGKEIQNLDGIEYFILLETLDCSYNGLAELPVLPSGLKELYCGWNYQLTTLPVLPSGLTILSCSNTSLAVLPTLPLNLKELDCGFTNKLTSLPKLPSNLQTLFCQANRLTELPALPAALKELYCYLNQLTGLPDLPNGLKELDCNTNQLTWLPMLPASLEILDCRENDIEALTPLPSGLKKLNCSWNRLTVLPALPSGMEVLVCDHNNFTELPALPSSLNLLDCSANYLEELPALPSGLTWLICNGNSLTELPMLPGDLTVLNCRNNQLTALPALPPGLETLDCSRNLLTGLDVTGLPLERLHCSYNNMRSEADVVGFTGIWGNNVWDQYIFSPQNRADGTDITAAFTDLNFKAAVYELIGKTAPAPIYDTDVAEVTWLDVNDREIESLAGLEYFTGLTNLNCGENLLEELPALPSGLEWLECHENKLIELPALPSGLKWLDCRGNQITALPTLPSGVTHFDCSENQLAELPALPTGLTRLWCAKNPLGELPTLPAGLEDLWCSENQLEELPTLPAGLTSLICDDNKLTALPILPSGLVVFSCSKNLLEELPELPSGLIHLLCEDNKLTGLPELPSGLTLLVCGTNKLATLPALPATLLELHCYQNLLTELPELPDGLLWLQFYSNQIAQLPELPTSLIELLCFDNLLTGLDVTGLPLTRLDCSYNNMKSEADVVGFTDIWDNENFIFSPQNGAPAPTDALILTPEAQLAEPGSTVTLSAAFTQAINSNTAILTFTFNSELFTYADFIPTAGVTVLTANSTDGQARIMVMKGDYNMDDLGDLLLRAKDEAAQTGEANEVALRAEYVVKGADESKETRDANASAIVKVGLLGDTNGDFKIDLIDLSNMIDWIGTNSSHPEWNTRYIYFDFNNNGEIDIADIAFVAKLL